MPTGTLSDFQINPVLFRVGMLETLGQDVAAQAIERAVMEITANRLKGLGAGQMGYSTSEVGDMTAELVAG